MLYAKAASMGTLSIITAGADEVVDRTRFSELSRVAKIAAIANARHDFQDDARPKVVQEVVGILARR